MQWVTTFLLFAFIVVDCVTRGCICFYVLIINLLCASSICAFVHLGIFDANILCVSVLNVWTRLQSKRLLTSLSKANMFSKTNRMDKKKKHLKWLVSLANRRMVVWMHFVYVFFPQICCCLSLYSNLSAATMKKTRRNNGNEYDHHFNRISLLGIDLNLIRRFHRGLFWLLVCFI